MEKINLKFAVDFTPYPGGRSRSTGDNSAEEFYEEHLQIKFKQAVKENKILSIDLDGAAGYAGSFLDEAFGRLGLLGRETYSRDELRHLAVNYAISCEKGFQGSFDAWLSGISSNWREYVNKNEE